MLMVTWCCSECCVPAGLDFEVAGRLIHCMLLLVQLFASRASSYCKHDMGALSWLNAERAPTPLFGRLVKCSAHGLSFTRYDTIKL